MSDRNREVKARIKEFLEWGYEPGEIQQAVEEVLTDWAIKEEIGDAFEEDDTDYDEDDGDPDLTTWDDHDLLSRDMDSDDPPERHDGP